MQSLAKITAGLALVVLTASLAACSSPEAPAPAETAAETEASELDRTAEFMESNSAAPWINSVTGVSEVATGRISITTTLVDPRDESDATAATAVAICEAALALPGDEITYVSVLENDGTNFVLFGHPLADPGACTEI